MTLEQLSAAATEGKLLPCPFCGREAQIVERVTGPNGPGFFCAVSCYCGGYSAKAHQSATSNNDQMARVEAITRWNHRTGQLVAVQPDDATVERVDATNPAPYRCKHGCERDALKDLNHTQAAEIERLKSRLAHVEKMYVESALSKGPKP